MSIEKIADKAAPPNYESTLKNIEQYVCMLEDTETSLEDSLEMFNNGVLLIRQAQALLANAEQVVMKLQEDSGAPKSSDLESKSGG